MRKAILLFTTLLILLPAVIAAAEDDSIYHPNSIGLTEEEMTRLDEIGINFKRTPPPPGVMRAVAEWEPTEGVIIRWPLGISVSLIAEMSEDIMVTTICGSTSQQSQAVSSYSSQGVNMANTQFIIAPTNTYWTRDYGPWFIFDGNGDIGIADHIYNRPRPQDDLIPNVIGTEWGIPVYSHSLETTGGNHMSDGLGMSFSTRLVYDENPGWSVQQIRDTMMAYLSNDYTVLEYIESGGIHHIDCWAKLLDPATILVKDVLPSNSSYALLNARADWLSQQMSPWERPYEVIRVYCPYGTAYTNSLILGNKVLVPIFSSSWDDDALAVYEEAMPGYEVLGFTGSWLDDDAIHCRAMGVPDMQMIWVHHIPLPLITGDTLNDFLVTATIFPHSDGNLIADSLKIYYENGEGIWYSSMLNSTVEPDSFYGYIPAQAAGSQIEYFIAAADDADKFAYHPVIGEPGAHKFKVNMPPTIVSPDTFFVAPLEFFSYYPEIDDVDDSTHQIVYSDVPVWLVQEDDSLFGTVPGDMGVDSFVVTVSDDLATDEATVFLVANMPPEIISPDSIVCRGGDDFGYYPEWVDPDDTEHEISYSGYPLWLSERNDSLVGTVPSEKIVESFVVEVSDPYNSTQQTVGLYIYLCGDADGNGIVEISDAVHLINYVFVPGSPAPDPLAAGDSDCNTIVEISDAVHLINYIFIPGSPAPCSDCP